MNESELKHREDLIKTAMPYAPQQNQQPMTMMLKMTELLHTFFKKEPDVSACSMNEKNTSAINLEGLLSSLKPLCRGSELTMISMLLNALQAQKFYKTYQTVASSLEEEMQTSNTSFMGNEADDFNSDFNTGFNSGFNSGFGSDSENENEDNPILNAASIQPNGSSKNQTNKNPSSQNKSNVSFAQVMNNPQMRDLLDTMMTPEQKNTFQNMNTILNAMNMMNAMNMNMPNSTPPINQPTMSGANTTMNPANLVNMMNMINSMTAANSAAPNNQAATNSAASPISPDTTPNTNANNTFGNLSGYYSNTRTNPKVNRNGLHTVHTMEITNPFDFEATPARTMDSLSNQFEPEML